MSGSNLVILARNSDKLSRGQARDWRPHEQTQATTIPEGQNWPRVKMQWYNVSQGYWYVKRYSWVCQKAFKLHYNDVTIVYSTGYSGAEQWKHQSSASLAFVGGIHRWQMNSTHIGTVTQAMFPFDDVIMSSMFNNFLFLIPYKPVTIIRKQSTAKKPWKITLIWKWVLHCASWGPSSDRCLGIYKYSDKPDRHLIFVWTQMVWYLFRVSFQLVENR